MWGKMQKHCVIAGCREENTSLHTLPRDPKIKHEWLKFIYCQIPEKLSLNLTVCSAHFSADCFINLAQYSAGFAQKLRLKDGAVPTLVQPTTIAHDQQSTAVVASACGEMSGAELEVQQNTVSEQDQNPMTCFNRNRYTIQQEEGELIREHLVNGGFKDYVCCVCGRCFAVLDELSNHFIIHKDKVRCHLCQTVFDQVISLVLHLENAHSKDLLFCRSCSITFTNVWHMNGHMVMHLQKQKTVDVHKEGTSPNQLTQEDFLCEVEEAIADNKEEEVRNLKEEEQEMIVHVKEEEEEVIIEPKTREMGAAKEFAENEQVEVKCVKEEEEQEITENREVDINNVKDEEVELDAVKTEEVDENVLEIPELDKMAWLHDHTYFSEQHSPFTDTTETSSEISEYLPSEFDQQDTSEDDQSVCGSLHDHNYFSTQSPASPVVSTRKHPYNTRSSVQKPASDVTNANAKDLPLYNNKANSSTSSEDSDSEDDQQESPAAGQRVCNVFRDHRYVPRQRVADPVVSEQVPAQTTRYTRKKTNYTVNAYSDSDTESDEQPESAENDQLLAYSLLDRERDQEVEEYIVSVDHEDQYISTRNKSKKPPDYAQKHSLQFDSGGSQEGCRSLLKGSTGGNPELNQACKHTKQKLDSCASENLQVCTHCGLSKVPNLERPMERCTCVPSFPCSLCRGTFGTKQLLMKHQADMHPLANYLCARCLQLFPNQDTFNKHICSTSNVLSGDSRKPQTSSDSVSSMFSNHVKQPDNGQRGSSFTFIKYVKAPQIVNTASSLSNSPPISDTQMVPGMAGRSLSCDQKQKVTVLNGNQRRETPISGVSQPKLGQVLTQTTFPKPTIQRHLPPPAPSQVSNSLSTPTQAGILPQSDIPLLPTQMASSPQSPLKIVAMFVNQSQKLALEKRLCQSWRSKTAFPCRQCGAVSRQPSLGIRHRYQHRGPRHHRCQCGRAFQQRLHLLRHQVQHAEASRYVCATCGQTFHGTHQLGNHLPRALFKITPTNGKISTRKVCRNVFHCACGQVFARPAALLWHMLTNSKARKSRLKRRRPVSM